MTWECKSLPDELEGCLWHIILNVNECCWLAQDGNEIQFKIKRSAQLRKLIKAYCERQGHPEDSVSFLYDGGQLPLLGGQLGSRGCCICGACKTALCDTLV